MSSLKERVELIRNKCNNYNNEQNKYLLSEIGVEEENIKSILQNITHTAKIKSKRLYLFIIIVAIINIIIDIIAFSIFYFINAKYMIISKYLYISCLIKSLNFPKMMNEFKQNKINRNLLNYILSTQLNSAQNSYDFYADSNLKIIGVIRSQNNDSIINNRAVNDMSKKLLINEHPTSSFIEDNSSNKLTPIFERFTIFSPIIIEDYKKMNKVLFYSNDMKELSKDELKELQIYGRCHNEFLVKNEICHNFTFFLICVFLACIITASIYYYDHSTKLGYRIIVTTVECLIMLLSLIVFESINRYRFCKYFKTYSAISPRKYRKMGLFVVESNEIFYLVKVSNYKSERPVQALNSVANYINNTADNNYNNADLHVNVNVNEIVNINSANDNEDINVNNDNNNTDNNNNNVEFEPNFEYDYVEKVFKKLISL